MLKWFADRLAQTGKKVGKEEKGFTLIELLVVVIIIGILAAIAIPTFLSQRENGWEAQTQSAVRNAATNAESHAVENGGSYAGLTAGIVSQGIGGSVALTVPDASANDYCILGNNSAGGANYNYDKADDAITSGGCGA